MGWKLFWNNTRWSRVVLAVFYVIARWVTRVCPQRSAKTFPLTCKRQMGKRPRAPKRCKVEKNFMHMFFNFPAAVVHNHVQHECLILGYARPWGELSPHRTYWGVPGTLSWKCWSQSFKYMQKQPSSEWMSAHLYTGHLGKLWKRSTGRWPAVFSSG